MTEPHDVPPPDLAALEAELRDLRFEPRASPGPEIAGRWAQGERAAPVRPLHRLQGAMRRHMRPLVGLAAAAVLAVGLAGQGLLGPAAAAAVQDHCCVDFDGQDTPDDGLLVETVGGEEVQRLVVYEDRDGDGRFSAGDLVNFERRGAPALAQTLGDGLVARRFCCTDYDGGGPADDGLLVVNAPGGGIVLAAIYETSRAVTPGVPALPPLR